MGSRRDAASALHSALSELTGVRETGEGSRDARPVALAAGTALAPRDAARCLVDFQRTAALGRGVAAAAVELAGRSARRPVRVLYAGCGPFATLVLPLLAGVPGPAEGPAVEITLLDVNPRSLEAAAAVVSALGASASIRDVVEADATVWRPAPGESFDLLVVEALQQSLGKEPQVAILRNLAPFLAPGGLGVPARIALHAALVGRAAAGAAANGPPPVETWRPLGRIFELSLATVAALPAEGAFPLASVKVPDDAEPGSVVAIRTLVTAREGVELLDYESGISYPTFLFDLAPRPGDEIAFSYELSATPGVRYRVLSR